jgi:hypothetical protein
MTEAIAPATGGQGAAPAVSAVAPESTGAFTEQNNGTPAAAPNGLSWLNGADETTIGYVQNKGWNDPRQVLDGYRNLEKLLGADKANNAVIVPKGDAEADAWNNLYDRLGRPSAPDGYGFKAANGDAGLEQALSGKFHELGLSKAQGEKFGAWMNEMIQSGQASEQQAAAARFQQDDMALKQEWGSAYMQNVTAANVAARALELDADTVDKISGAIGHKATMSLLARIGAGYEEDGFVTSGDAPGFGNVMTPGQAKAAIQEKMSDPVWAKAYQTGGMNSKEFKEMQRLQALAFPEQAGR